MDKGIKNHRWHVRPTRALYSARLLEPIIYWLF